MNKTSKVIIKIITCIIVILGIIALISPIILIILLFKDAPQIPQGPTYYITNTYRNEYFYLGDARFLKNEDMNIEENFEDEYICTYFFEFSASEVREEYVVAEASFQVLDNKGDYLINNVKRIENFLSEEYIPTWEKSFSEYGDLYYGKHSTLVTTTFSSMLLKQELTYKFSIKMLDKDGVQLCKPISLYKFSSYVKDFVHHTKWMEDGESAYVPSHLEKEFPNEWQKLNTVVSFLECGAYDLNNQKLDNQDIYKKSDYFYFKVILGYVGDIDKNVIAKVNIKAKTGQDNIVDEKNYEYDNFFKEENYLGENGNIEDYTLDGSKGKIIEYKFPFNDIDESIIIETTFSFILDNGEEFCSSKVETFLIYVHNKTIYSVK